MGKKKSGNTSQRKEWKTKYQMGSQETYGASTNSKSVTESTEVYTVKGGKNRELFGRLS